MRLLPPVLLAAVLVAATATPAWAHGDLTPSTVGPGETTSAVLILPSERDGARTTRVVLAMPSGFTARTCEQDLGWTCSVAADAVEWRDLAGTTDTTHFQLSLTASTAPGTYTLPVQQTYDDGTEAVFAGRPGSKDSAPVMTVTGATPTSTSRPIGTPRPTPTPARTVIAPAASPRTTVTAAPVATRSASRSPAPYLTPAPSATPAFERPSSLPRGALVLPARAASGRGPVVVAVALLLAALTALVLARRRTSRSTGH